MFVEEPSVFVNQDLAEVVEILDYVLVWFRCHDSGVKTRLQKYADFIITMTNAAKVEFITEGEAVADGCTMTTVGHDVEVHLMLKVRIYQ